MIKPSGFSILELHHVGASIEGKQILQDITFSVQSGQVHAIMGPNGSGKSTLASVLLGYPAYEVAKKSKVLLDGKNILNFSTDRRAKAGLFLAFQSPVAIAGVSVMNLLRTSLQSRDKNIRSSKVQSPALSQRFQVGSMSMFEFGTMLKAYAKKLNLDEILLHRGIHDGFSGGEKKKIEMLQALVLKPRFAIFDEIDTGLDVDALKAVSYGISELQKLGVGVIIITHYQRILKYVKPDFVHILVAGNIAKTGAASLAKEIESSGYSKYT